jgi:prepilin-type N-terminal cleavage/methylation domain-containing protein
MPKTCLPSRPPRRGFTLIEVLVVLTIIIIIATAAMPAIRFITGSRSVESTQNIVGGMLGQARTSAVVNHEVRGVFFFLDPVTDRTTMALVRQDGENSPNPDLDAYKGWTDGKDWGAPQTINYYKADPTLGLPSFANALTTYSLPLQRFTIPGNPPPAKPTLQMFKCIKDTGASALATNAPKPTAPPGNQYWGNAIPLYLEIVDNTDFQLLPKGVGVQLMNDQKGTGSNDRYLRTGVILFTGTGEFTSVNYDVKASSKLGRSIGLGGADLDGATNPPKPNSPYYSQFGLVLYDRETMKAVAKSSEGDWMTRNVLSGMNNPGTLADEQNEEIWLDTNSLPLLVNRYNGTLIKGE